MPIIFVLLVCVSVTLILVSPVPRPPKNFQRRGPGSSRFFPVHTRLVVWEPVLNEKELLARPTRYGEVQQIQARHEKELFQAGVIDGVGIGNDASGGWVLHVYARRGTDLSRIPNLIEGVPVGIVESSGPHYHLRSV